MLQIIVFSFNRALQLDTLLDTLLEHWKAPVFELDVVYNTSSRDFQKGYESLIAKYCSVSNVRFHKESAEKADRAKWIELLNPWNLKHWLQHSYIRNPKTNFRSLTTNLMEQSEAEQVMFLTDDAMFINDVDVSKDMLEWLMSEATDNQYSLRVGIGLDDKEAHYQNNGEHLSWRFCDENPRTNWGYCFSVDAHIYAKSTILILFKRNLFVNPNTLEGPIREDARRNGWLQNGRGPQYPALLSFPINMVQTVATNESLGVSIEKLNDYYLEGYTMRYPKPKHPNHFQQYPKELLFRKGDEIKTLQL